MTARTFLRQNVVMVLGVVLPFLVILAFLLAQGITTARVPAPTYRAVFALVPYYGDDNPFEIDTDNGMLTVEYNASKRAQAYRDSRAALNIYVFDPTAGTTEKYEIAPPFNAPENEAVSVILPAPLLKMQINPVRQAPDGYKFERVDRNGAILFSEFFGTHYRGSTFALKHAGRTVLIPSIDEYGKDILIGWVKP